MFMTFSFAILVKSVFIISKKQLTGVKKKGPIPGVFIFIKTGAFAKMNMYLNYILSS